jgi:uncharacterized membrane protein YdbT with pleckstrin-like domain
VSGNRYINLILNGINQPWISSSQFSRLCRKETPLGYVESSLLPDEQVVYKATLHWKIFFPSWLIILVGIFLLIFEPIVGGAVVFVGLLIGLRAFVKYKTSEFAVTTKRVIIKVGVFRRRTLELLLRQVEAISVDQTVFGRMFGFGSLTLTGTGGVHEVFHDISSPLEFRRQIHAQAA